MMSGKNKWSTVVDYFLILSAIIGVGFASGKEICIFFFDWGTASIFGLASFFLLYCYLFFIVEHIRQKLKIQSYNDFNARIFGKMVKLSNLVMLINFSITCAGMLAGADYLFLNFFGIGYKIPSILLSVLAFMLLLGGINKIKIVADLIIPIMIIVIIVNAVGNVDFSNMQFQALTIKNSVNAVYYGILFGVNNFVAAFPVLFETKLKKKGKLAVIVSICIIIILNILVLASKPFISDMPMFELSRNLGMVFYIMYFITIVMALFSTLMICSYNIFTMMPTKQNNKWFVALIIVLFNLIVSNFGYGFIVKYLYVVSAIFSGVYVIGLVVMISIHLIKNKSK